MNEQTLFRLKEQLAMVGIELKNAEKELSDKAGDPAVPIAEVEAAETKKNNLQKRFNIIKGQHDTLAEEQRADLRIRDQQRKGGVENAKNEAERKTAIKAAFYRAAILKQPMPDEVKAQLQAIPADGGTGGENLLPTNLSTELIHEPFVQNQLRSIIRMSNIKGLEVPKIAFEIDDDSFIDDEDTAQEIEATGDKVSFGRFKFKVKVRVSDTVIHGSDIDLVNYIENALRSGLAAKEKAMSFAADGSLDPDEEHMSFYTEDEEPKTLIKTVEGADMFEAITNAIADLHESFRENAKVVMTYADYVTMLKDLSNNSRELFSVPPEKIIGKPVVFSDAAEVPIVGDFNYYRLNYDGAPIYDSDKNVDKGEYIWVLTCWFDQRFLLRSAFRLAEVVPEGEGGNP